MPEPTGPSIDMFVYNQIKLMKNKNVCMFHPNVYTFLGLSCIPLIVYNIYFHESVSLAIFIIFIKSSLDILDGSIARKCNLVSEFGHTLDHLSDLLFYGAIGLLLLYKSISNRKHYHSFFFVFSLFHLYKFVVGLNDPSNFKNTLFKFLHDNSLITSPVFIYLVKLYYN